MSQKDKILLHLWFDTEAMAAAEYYTNIFPDSKLLQRVELKDTPSGEVELVSFSLAGVRFEAISAGPFLKINDSIRIIVFCDSIDERNGYKEKLADEVIFDGEIIWLKDSFGVYWGLTVRQSGEFANLPKVCPLIDGYGFAEEMCQYYQKEFSTKSSVLVEKLGNWQVLKVADQPLILANITQGKSQYTGALSLLYLCENQAEIDSFYNGFSADASSEQCGWLVDKYGISWQIVPRIFLDFASQLSTEEYQRVNQQILKMKKIVLADLGIIS